MDPLSRRQFIRRLTLATVGALTWPATVGADSACEAPHPLMPPDAALTGRCPNCGMVQAMWARTWKTFRLAGSAHEACSFHCLADMAVKADQPVEDVRTALFLHPRGMVTAEAAWYVVGSSVNGTMTKVSKAAFVSRTGADDFAQACGGRVMDYGAVFALAKGSLTQENAMIDRRRLATKKIVPPVDLEDECVACRMYPSRFPRHRSQISRSGERILHFCSTHCLFAWLGDAKSGTVVDSVPGMIWITDFPTGRWISAKTAYYVVASRAMGPMGVEAFAFDRKAQAREFADAKGGRILEFHQIRRKPSAWGFSL